MGVAKADRLWLCAISAMAFLAFASLPAIAESLAVFGTFNRAQSAPARTSLADGFYQAGNRRFQVSSGLVFPAEDLVGATPGRHVPNPERPDQIIEIRANHLCVSDVRELRSVLSRGPKFFGGLTLCLNPGRYALGPPDLRDQFTGLSTTKPLVVTATHQSRPPVLTYWEMGSNTGAVSGHVTLRDLRFEIESAEVAIGENGFVGHKPAIAYGIGGPTRNFHIERVNVVGNLGEARLGARETQAILYGVRGLWGHNISIRNSRFEKLTHAINIGGEEIVVEGNRFRRGWADLIQISNQVTTGPCQTSEQIEVRNNILYDPWSNHRFHPDLVHMFASPANDCDIRKVLIEGNIAFLGAEGTRQPAFPSYMANTRPRRTPAVLPATDGVLHRLTGSGAVTLPQARCAEADRQFAVQRQPGSGAFSLVPSPGDRFWFYGTEPRDTHIFTADWETWILLCRKVEPGVWRLLQAGPSIQGVFTNALPEKAGFKDITIRYNIFWVNAHHGATFRDRDDRGISVYRNSFLQPFPGDRNGDGLPNTPADGFNAFSVGTGVLLMNGTNMSAWENITSSIGHRPLSGRDYRNDDGLRHNDMGTAMIRRFVPSGRNDDGTPQFFPTRPTEAVRFARPKSGGLLDGRNVGALGVTPGHDPYNWSWVDDAW